MIDVDTLLAINKSQNECKDIGELEMTFQSDCDKTMEALGNDETEIINFIKTADNELLLLLSQVLEEISSKFPSDEMDKALDIIVNVM